MKLVYFMFANIFVFCIHNSLGEPSVRQTLYKIASKKFCKDYPTFGYLNTNKEQCAQKCHGYVNKCLGFCINLSTELCTVYSYPFTGNEETIEYSGHRYFFSSTSRTFDEAEQHCQENNASISLPDGILPAGEGYRVASGDYGTIFVGIKKEAGSAKFKQIVDGTVVLDSDNRWTSGQPSEATQDTVVVDMTQAGTLDDFLDHKKRLYYCQAPMPGKCSDAPFEPEIIQSPNQCYHAQT